MFFNSARRMKPGRGCTVLPQLEALEDRSLPAPLAFFAAATQAAGTELWKSDGSQAGTTLVKDINVTAAGASSYPQSLTNVGGVIFFTADDGAHTGRELWKSNGTPNGTVVVKDINLTAPRAGSYPGFLTNVNGTVFFATNDGVIGNELWKSDGTVNGTVWVKDIIFGVGGSAPRDLTKSIGKVLFAASDCPFAMGGHGDELWQSDGTPLGTSLVGDINIPGDSFPANLKDVNDNLFFSADDGVHGREWWESKRTAGGGNSAPILVKDIFAGPNPSLLSSFAAITDTLIFSAKEPSKGSELWKSDGTEAGTVVLKDIRMGPPGSYPSGMKSVGTLWVFFSANDGTHGRELFWTDGTANNTTMVKDIWSGATGSDPSRFVDGAAGAGASALQSLSQPIHLQLSLSRDLTSMINSVPSTQVVPSVRLASDVVFSAPGFLGGPFAALPELGVGKTAGTTEKKDFGRNRRSNGGDLFVSLGVLDDQRLGQSCLVGI